MQTLKNKITIMKKLFLLIISAMIILPCTSYAQDKMLKKEVAAKKKEYAKEGWKLFGTSRTIDAILYSHYSKLNDGYEEITGSAPRFTSKNVGHQMAYTSASNQYAQRMSSSIEGYVKSNIGSNGQDISKEIDQFMASFKREVELNIKGELIESYSVIKELEPGVYEMMSFYIINPNASSQAKVRALENLAKENEIAKKLAAETNQKAPVE